MNTSMAIITAIHLAALSQVESDDRDNVIGPCGEVSRYQMRPAVWRKAEDLAGRKLDPIDEKTARIVAFDEWSRRAEVFRLANGRAPSVRELYLLWHRPARVDRPRRLELARAERFENLYLKFSNERK